jgi:hypothetical protein
MFVLAILMVVLLMSSLRQAQSLSSFRTWEQFTPEEKAQAVLDGQAVTQSQLDEAIESGSLTIVR